MKNNTNIKMLRRTQEISILKRIVIDCSMYFTPAPRPAYATDKLEKDGEEARPAQNLILRDGLLHWGKDTYEVSWGKNERSQKKINEKAMGVRLKAHFIFVMYFTGMIGLKRLKRACLF